MHRRDLQPQAAADLLAWIEADNLETPPPAEKRMFAGFVLDRLVGEGASSLVFRAFRPGSDRPVAVKLYRGVVERAHAARARRELDLLDSLRLPCVPRVLDSGTVDGRMFIVEEFITGEHFDSAASRLAPDDLRGRVRLLIRAARAVQSIHERGVIHRDLKPSNLLVSSEGEIFVVDFGLALRSALGTTSISLQGVVLGTPAFMAPEQASGDRAAVSTRTDVYGLGATGYLVLTGSTPHDTQGSLHDVLRRLGTEPARDPRSLRAELPAPLCAILLAACASAPAARYASAGGLADDFERWINGAPVEAQAPSWWVRMTRKVQRHAVLSTAIACAALLIATLGGVWLGLQWMLSRTPVAVLVSHDQQVVRVVNAAQTPLRTWRSPNKVIALQHRDSTSPARDTVVIAHIYEPEASTGFSLAAYELQPGVRLKWSSAIDWGGKPGKKRITEPSRMVCHGAWLEEVFGGPDSTPEVIAMFCGAGLSASVVQVLDLSTGKVLWEAWHDGALHAERWSAATRQLVVAGWNSEIDGEPRALVRELGSKQDPYVVMALAIPPEPLIPGQTTQPRWIRTPSSHEPLVGNEIIPVWYKFFGPASSMRSLHVVSGWLDACVRLPGVEVTRLLLGVSPVSEPGSVPHSSIVLVLDEQGNTVGTESSSYVQEPGMPTSDSVWLDDVSRFLAPGTRAPADEK